MLDLSLSAFATAAIAAAVGIYGTPSQLNGALLYDDKAAILRNPVVTGSAPIDDVLRLDFWGENDISSPQSHKSWRPLVTLSYRLNYALHTEQSYGYHVVNCALHAIVSALVIPVARTCGLSKPASGLAALLFAVHPVHVEAVQNIVGRAELMMSCFYLVGLLCYAGCLRRGRPISAILLCCVCTLGGMLCKETGATLPAACAAWDVLLFYQLHPRVFLYYTVSLPFFKQPSSLLPPPPPPSPPSDDTKEDRPSLLSLAARVTSLAACAMALGVWRLSLNGSTSPEFNVFENPAALHPHPFYRWLSITWVWYECIWVLWVPTPLSCDWSYPALPPISSLADPRVPALLAAFILSISILLYSITSDTPRPRILLCIALMVLPFLLASNLLTIVGFAKAERVLYLPSIGVCMASGLCIGGLGSHGGRLGALIGCGLAAALVYMYAVQCLWYAEVWTNGEALWANAVRVQEGRPEWLRGGPSTHALAEYGMQLSWAGKNKEAAVILERQMRLSEADAASTRWPTAGRLQFTAYAALSIVYRILGDGMKAVAVAERGLAFIGRVKESGHKDIGAAEREAARCVAARALAVFGHDERLGISQMQQAVGMSRTDPVVNALAMQLETHLRSRGGS